MHDPILKLAAAVLTQAWGEVETGACPTQHAQHAQAERLRGKPGRPRHDGCTSAYASYWRSYLLAIKTLCEGTWKEMVDVESKKYLAVLLSKKFGVPRSRDLVSWALKGGAPENPPHWWVERRKWAPPKEG